MSLQPYDIAAMTGTQGNFRLCVEVLAKCTVTPANKAWCDINWPSNRAGDLDTLWGRLIALPTVNVTGELMPGRFTYSVSQLEFDDDDHAFGQPCTPDSPIPLIAVEADGSYTMCQLETWHNALVRLRIVERLTDPDTDTYHPLGIFRIKDIHRSSQKKQDPRSNRNWIWTARMELTPCSKALQETSAREVRRGDTWLTNVPVPLLVKELVERGSKGDYTTSDDLPASITPTGTRRQEFSTLGNVPTLKGDGTWNESRTFVPRYQFASPTYHYFLGYSALRNCPSLTAQNISTGAWVTTEWTDWAGFEAVFGVVSGAYLYVACVSQQTTYGDGFPQNKYNHACEMFRVPANNVAGTRSHYATKPVWRMGQAVARPISTNPQAAIWGTWDTMLTGPPAGMPVPFAQTVSIPVGPRRIAARTNADDQQVEVYPLPGVTDEFTLDISEPFPVSVECPTGYIAGVNRFTESASFPRTLYHDEFHESFRYSVTRDAIYWMFWNQTNPTTGAGDWFFARFECGTLTTFGQQVRFGAGDGTVEAFWSNCVTAFEIYASGATNKAWIATQQYDIDGWGSRLGVPLSTRLWHIATFGTGGFSSTAFTDLHSDFSTITYNSDRKYAPVFITLRATHAGLCISGQVCDRFGVSGHCYGLWAYYNGTYNFIYTNLGGGLPRSASPFSLASNLYSDSATYYLQDQATGQVWSYVPAFAAVQSRLPTLLSYGDSVDDENTWASANLYWDMNRATLYGVSAAEPAADSRVGLQTTDELAGHAPQLSVKTPAGRISLWQWALGLSGVIRVADFGDSRVWDALEMARQYAGDFILGFERDATTESTPRPQVYIKARGTVEPTYTIVEAADGINPNDGTAITCQRLEAKLDTQNIVNQVSVPVYIGRVAAPEITIVLNGDADGNRLADAIAHQTSNAAQTIILRAVRDGFSHSPDYAEGAPLAQPLFTWSVAQSELVTGLRVSAAPGDTQIRITGLYEDAKGAKKIGDSEIRAGDFVVVGGGPTRTIESITVSDGRLNLDNPVGGDSTHKVGTTVTITPKARSRYANSTDGVCVIAEPGFTVPAADALATMFVDSTANLAPGMLLYRDTAYVQIVSVRGNDWIVVKGGILGTLQGQTATWAVGTILSGALWFEHPGRAYSIGGTGVSVALLPRSGDNDDLGIIKAGDAIRISCKGLSAERDDMTTMQASDPDSISRYGPKEWRPSVENRLMTRTRARIILEDAPQLAIPAYVTTATNCPFMPNIEIGDTFYCKHAHLWPAEDDYLGVDSSNRVAHTVTSIAHNTAQRKTTLSLRSYKIGGRTAAGDSLELPGGYVKPVIDRRTAELTP